MANKIVFTIPLEPVAKGRPRFARNGHAYTPQKTRSYEEAVRLIAQRVTRRPLKGEISIIMDFYMPIPKSWSEGKKWASENKKIRPVVKPDIDNLAKACIDAMNKVCFSDDKQIVELRLRKFYGEPRTEIQLEEL